MHAIFSPYPDNAVCSGYDRWRARALQWPVPIFSQCLICPSRLRGRLGGNFRLVERVERWVWVLWDFFSVCVTTEFSKLYPSVVHLFVLETGVATIRNPAHRHFFKMWKD